VSQDGDVGMIQSAVEKSHKVADAEISDAQGIELSFLMLRWSMH
jgi:hypothetical protein